MRSKTRRHGRKPNRWYIHHPDIKGDIDTCKPLQWLQSNAGSYHGTFTCDCYEGAKKGETFDYTV